MVLASAACRELVAEAAFRSVLKFVRGTKLAVPLILLAAEPARRALQARAILRSAWRDECSLSRDANCVLLAETLAKVALKCFCFALLAAFCVFTLRVMTGYAAVAFTALDGLAGAASTAVPRRRAATSLARPTIRTRCAVSAGTLILVVLELSIVALRTTRSIAGREKARGAWFA